MELLIPGHIADAAVAGGKGSNLLKLVNASHNIPRFVIIPSGVLQNLSGLSADEQAFLLEPIIARISNQLGPVKTFAVRSSVCAEDGTGFSFAGQFKTCLNVSEDALASAIMEVFQSASAISVNTYKNFAGETTLNAAVIVQEMINATASGVAFGIDPLNGDTDNIVINAVAGLGEKLVSGAVNADTYIFNKNTKELTEQKINPIPVLDEKKVALVVELIKKVERSYDHPQDIEFAFDGNQLFLLQSRPVTHKKASKTIWDNSNIVESYPGITLPLTSSFLDKVYAAVYKQLCSVLGVSNKKIKNNHPLFDNLLGFINGRVYYNLNSWFGILALLPGYKLNASFMEKMMGVKNKPDLDSEEKKEKRSVSHYLEVINAIRCIISNLRSANKQRIAFLTDFDAVYQRFSDIDHTKLSVREIWENYCCFERLMVERWKAPLVNDFFTMVYFGVLQKYCSKYFPDEPNLCNELIASSKDIITTEPAKQLPALAVLINSNQQLKEIFLQETPGEIWKVLCDTPAYTKEGKAIRDYIGIWGERCVAELKLETITYRQQPEMLIAVLQSYLKNKVFSFPEDHNAEAKRLSAEAKMFSALSKSPLQKMIFKHVLSKGRYFISNRENLRYYRTKGFGLVREMMLALGHQMREHQLLDNDRDIFYLRLYEIEEIVNKNEFKNGHLIAQRKDQYGVFEHMPTEERIITFNHKDKYFTYPVSAIQGKATGVTSLQGIPCSPGIVQAKVRLVTHSKQLEVLDGNIMATYATDPGWVVLFPSASGILTERGSLLSHAAIVSREMGIPCIVGISGLMQHLKDGDTLVMDGSTGIVNILSRNDEHPGKS